MTNEESFPTLVYQYVDFAGSPDEIEKWKAEDLHRLIAMAQSELKRRGDEPRAEPVSAWLLECVPPLGDVLYYCAPGDWCSNPNHAHRFTTKEEGDAMHGTMHNSAIMRVAEHQWG